MASLFPCLVSDTRILMVDMFNSSVIAITEGAFRLVDKLWQLSIFRTNITKIESRAVPDGGDGGLSVSPSNVQPEWTPFILNDTRVELIETNALLFNISGKDEYLNVVNCYFGLVKRGGLRVTGAGHVLLADSTFNTIEDDGFSVELQLGQKVDPALRLFAYPTLTLMGVNVQLANITNFLDNLRVTGGKIYLIRMEYHQLGALAAVISHAQLWNNATTFIERWTVGCNCADLAGALLIQQADEALGDSTEPYVDDEHKAERTAPSSSHWNREVKCRVEGSPEPVELFEFQQIHCSQEEFPVTDTTDVGDISNDYIPSDQTTEDR